MHESTTNQYLRRRGVLRAIAGSAVVSILAACSGASKGSGTPTAGTAASGAAPEGPKAGAMTAASPAPPVAGTRSSGTGVSAPATVIAVAATTTQIQDFVANIGGNRIALTGILKPNVDPHDYEPTIDDANAIAQAQVVFVHGIGLDSWIGKTIKEANANAPVITTTDNATILKGDEAEPEGDPHCWFDPTIARTMVMNIANGLAKVDAAGASVYQQNAAAYAAQLARMDAQVQGIYNQVPRDQRKLVTNHDAFQYLANHFGLTIVGAVIPSLSDTAEPSAKEISDLIDTIKKERVKAIFAEASANPKVAQQVAQETNIKIVDTLYGDTWGPPGSDGDTYLKMMVADATTITSALQ